MKKRGQVSVEYVLIFSVVILITIPTIYLFRNYIVESSGRIAQQRLEVVAKDIIDNAREVYYLGAPSRVVIEVEMPDDVKNMYAISGSNEYYLAFDVYTQHGENTRYFESDVKIKPAPVCASCPQPICETGFTCEVFENKFFTPGKKQLRIETKSDISETYVEIREYS